MSSAITREPRYRPAKPIPDELCRHCTIFFDESLYINALNLLTDIVTLGAALPAHLAAPAFTPLPFHIELVSVLLIHPRYTNQATTAEHVAIASKCIIFLRNLLAILGPVNARLAEAFSFASDLPALDAPSTRVRRRGQGNTASASCSIDLEDQMNCIKGLVANQGRTRRCARDFWHVVGWSFNCSTRYPQRWKYLKVWLEYMIEVLDVDWRERTRSLSETSHDGDSTRENATALTQTIIITYLSGIADSSAAMRRVVKALFADGSDEDLRTFPEVFPNEIQAPKLSTSQKRKRQNSINGNSASWPDNLEDVLDEADVNLKRSPPACVDKHTSQPESCSRESDALVLRQRLIALLSRVAATVPHLFISCARLHELMYEYIRLLPTSIFARLISSAPSSHLSNPVIISLSRILLKRLQTKSISGADDLKPSDYLSQHMLVNCYLPFPALALDDQAKVSFLLENLMLLLFKSHAITYSSKLAEALERGIIARERKLMQRKKMSQVPMNHSETDSSLLKASSMRLRMLLCWMQTSQKKLMVEI